MTPEMINRARTNARKLEIKPAPLKGLKRKHARAIERCLSFERKDRPQNAG